MGCDFYECMSIQIEYQEKDSTEVKYATSELARSPRYFCGFDVDSDEEDDYNNKLKRYMEIIQNSCSKTLFENGHWKITAKEKISLYTNIANDVVKDGTILKIEKKAYCVKR